MGAWRRGAWALGGVASWATAASAQPVAPPAAEARGFVANRQGVNRWEGSLFAGSFGVDLGSYVTPVATREVGLAFGLAPRVWLGRGFQLRAGLSFARAFSNHDTTTTRNETRFHDGALDLWFHGIPSFAGFHPAVAVGLTLPLSPESRARTLLVGTPILGQLAWWRRVSSVVLFARLSLGWEHRFYEYTTPGVRSSSSFRAMCYGGGGGCSNQLSGVASITDFYWASLTFAPRWRYVSPGVSFAYTIATPAAFDGVIDGRTASETVHNFTTFSVWLEFVPAPPVSVIISYTQSRSVLDGDGTYGNPFWAPFQHPAVALTVALRLDELAAAFRREPMGPGGVVRW